MTKLSAARVLWTLSRDYSIYEAQMRGPHARMPTLQPPCYQGDCKAYYPSAELGVRGRDSHPLDDT